MDFIFIGRMVYKYKKARESSLGLLVKKSQSSFIN